MKLRAGRDGLRLSALVLVCHATTAKLGSLDPVGLVLLFAAIALMLLSLFAPSTAPVPDAGWAVAIAALLMMMLEYPIHAPDAYDLALVRPLVALAVVAAVTAVVLRRRHRLALWLTGAVGVVQLSIIAVSLRRSWGGPPIDVFDVQQAASWSLLHGANPYTPLVEQFVGNGVSPGRLVGSHFPYGPSIAILDMPSRLLGDVRLTHLAAFAALLPALVVMARREGSGREWLIAVLWVAFPLTAGMVEYAWIDIITMAGLGGWLVLRDRHRRWAIPVLAVALAAKPIFLPALLPIFIWSRRGRWEITVAGITAGLLVLPFAVATGAGAFYADVVETHLNGEPRYDSLNLESYLHLTGLGPLPLTVTAAAALVVAALTLARRPRDQGDMITAGAVICTFGFLMVKRAFFNYYFIPAVLLVVALAVRQRAVDGLTGRRNS